MPPLLEKLHIQAFRGLRDVQLDQLGQANILLGLNDSGKTSVLEALLLLTQPRNPITWLRVALLREPVPFPLEESPRTSRLRWLFPSSADEGMAGELCLTATPRSPGRSGLRRVSFYATFTRVTAMRPRTSQEKWTQGATAAEVMTEGAEIEVSDLDSAVPQTTLTFWEQERVRDEAENALLPGAEVVMAYDHWLRPFGVERFSQARLESGTNELVSLLQLLDPGIRGMEVLQFEGQTTLYVQHDSSGLVPLSAFGDGVRRTLRLAEAVSRAKGGFLLIDEIETGIHVDAITGVFTWLLKACRQFDVQLFVTTHSIEAVDAMLKADNTPDEDVVGYRLGNDGTRTTVKRYGEAQLRWMREERGLDVRK